MPFRIRRDQVNGIIHETLGRMAAPGLGGTQPWKYRSHGPELANRPLV